MIKRKKSLKHIVKHIFLAFKDVLSDRFILFCIGFDFGLAFCGLLYQSARP